MNCLYALDLGGYSVGVPPLPIPIRQLADKPDPSADGPMVLSANWRMGE